MCGISCTRPLVFSPIKTGSAVTIEFTEYVSRMGMIVMCSYRPHTGQESALEALIASHVPMLRRYGLVTDRVPIQAQASDGTRIEVFEWTDSESSEKAHSTPEISSLWAAFASIAEFIPLSTLPETQGPFANFVAR